MVNEIFQYRPGTGSIKPSKQQFQFSRFGRSLGKLFFFSFFVSIFKSDICKLVLIQCHFAVLLDSLFLSI
jgi:hypothetical protein